MIKNSTEKKEIEALFISDVHLGSRGCNSIKLIEILNNIHYMIQGFRVAGYSSHQRSIEATSDHIKVIDALLQHDSDLAEQLMREHIEKTKQRIIQNFKEQKTKEH